MNNLNIGLFGFDFTSSNKGCEALTYTFLSMIERMLSDEKIVVYNFTYNESLGKIPENFPDITFNHVKINLKNPGYWINANKVLKKCSVFFDATFGDGFSDIYGEKWNVQTDLIKQMVIWSGTPLVLVPQTYGPYKNHRLEKWAMNIIKKSALVYSRDDVSARIIKENTGTEIRVASDMAFKLPFDKGAYHLSSGKIKVGINISSLLWDSEWAKENYFGLTVDYHKYHTAIIEDLINRNDYELHIIPHVIDLIHPDSRENDYRICLKLGEKYKDKLVIAPPFETPLEAKSYIANMDIFIGSRMHATIGSISSGVATIPFSYSRKFEGLFGNIGYPYVISAKEISTKEAIDKTQKWIKSYRILKQKGREAVACSMRYLDNFEADVLALLGEYK